jgi:glutamine synthetase
MIVKLEYIWLDGYSPEPNLRSKTKVWDYKPEENPKHMVNRQNGCPSPDELPTWSYDGSSTEQAEGRYSDCLLNPVRVIRDPQRKNAYLVMCEVLNPDGTPHESNTRHLVPDNKPDKGVFVNTKDFTTNIDELWFGFEQEYTLIGENEKPLGFPDKGHPDPQGQYYCAVGTRNVKGREIAEQHLDVCLSAGLNLTGINAEVLLGQWEYQLLGYGAKEGADDLWLSRYLLHRICEQHGIHVEFHPKPVKGDWNGSGLHTNFSNKQMREEGGKDYIMDICDSLKERHEEFIENYGSSNDERLTGSHETNHISRFNVGESDRGASIRIPVGLVNNGWKGYLEDRRPASNADPYKITRLLSEVLNNVNQTVN